MHKVHHWAVRCFAAALLVTALPASAYLQFTNVVSNSAHGDQVVNRFHPITSHGEWIQLAQLEFTFADMKNRGIWTVEKIALPEPGLTVLLLTGLGMLAQSRRRRKRQVHREKTCLKSVN